ncbi:hypothetical protein PsYK624_052440 [Phanerochaete sordida]|uniref:Uncharacterized protein n=1 Tax=Phanerochaete sordida TaxID=48140 RepID=A0A9P3G7C5_9APHY|nr:hypothetical protein PsYK624_052440 [Phanerochaete sordida]
MSALLWLSTHILQLRLAAYVYCTRPPRPPCTPPTPAHTSLSPILRRRDRPMRARTVSGEGSRDRSLETLRQLLLPTCLLLSLLCGVPGPGLVLASVGIVVDAGGGGLIDEDFVRHVRRSVVRVRFANPLTSAEAPPPRSPTVQSADAGRTERGESRTEWAAQRSLVIRMAVYATAAYGARCIITAGYQALEA